MPFMYEPFVEESSSICSELESKLVEVQSDINSDIGNVNEVQEPPEELSTTMWQVLIMTLFGGGMIVLIVLLGSGIL